MSGGAECLSPKNLKKDAVFCIIDISMENETVYLTRETIEDFVVAARPKTGAAAVFNVVEKKWVWAHQNYMQIISDTCFDEITREEAQKIFQDIPPDDFLNAMDKKIMRWMGKNRNDEDDESDVPEKIDLFDESDESVECVFKTLEQLAKRRQSPI